jgi:hypothetical protein
LRFLRNGRDLGEWSHRDFSYQGPLVAALILLDYLARYGPQVLAAANPYRQHPTQTGVVSFGPPDILDQVARSANAAMKPPGTTSGWCIGACAPRRPAAGSTTT